MCSVYTIYLKSFIFKLYSLKRNFRKRQFSLGSDWLYQINDQTALKSVLKRILFYSLNKVGSCR